MATKRLMLRSEVMAMRPSGASVCLVQLEGIVDVWLVGGLRGRAMGSMFARATSSGLGLRVPEVRLGRFHRRGYDCCVHGAWSFAAPARTSVYML